jgi:hypothetical protein
MTTEKPKNTEVEDIEEILDIIEGVYLEWIDSLKTKMKNIRKLNLKSLNTLIELEKQRGRIKGKKDIIRYIEGLIQD